MLIHVLSLMLACIPRVASAQGSTQAVYDLIERIMPGQSSHFELSFANCSGTNLPCFILADGADGTLQVQGTGASELTAGLGYYLREYVGWSLGWPRGGGSHTCVPSPWPTVGATAQQPLQVNRSSWLSFIENVCTHSYSLVWYDWPAWSSFIDWMALYGINLAVAPTGQEEMQWRVFTQLGLHNDSAIRSWFNGPAFLTWSRGQNGHGSSIGGPLPRSWMRGQLSLQQSILARYRELGIVGQLPAFQGNVPWALAAVLNNTNMTQMAATGWMDSLDPSFPLVSDAWMRQLCDAMGCVDHYYQADGYFHNGTTWGEGSKGSSIVAHAPPCQWGPAIPDTYLAGCCADRCAPYATLQDAQAACEVDPDCAGVTVERGHPQKRAGNVPTPYANETSYVILNELACHELPVDPMWAARGKAAYAGMARTDPLAVWNYQGWAFYVDNLVPNARSLSYIRGFTSAPPPGHMLIIDMSEDGSGQWQPWAQAAGGDTGIWGAPFVWTSLHTFGGGDSLKGNVSKANRIPFDALQGGGPAPPATPWTLPPTGVVGSGYTPEGIDQNPAYYELIQEAAWRSAPLPDPAAWLVRRAHRRYGLWNTSSHGPITNKLVVQAWSALANSSYSEDLTVSEGTGVGLLPGKQMNHWIAVNGTTVPTPFSFPYKATAGLCQTWDAWGALVQLVSSGSVNTSLPTLRYDVVNTGREMLAQISTPLSILLYDATYKAGQGGINATLVQAVGQAYITLLQDLDSLVGTEPAFLLGPWLQSARAWGAIPNASDCTGTVIGDLDCPHFMEWNARCQITTWYPTPARGQGFPGQQGGRDNDYARKHWSGLIRDYYAVRAELLVHQAVVDGLAGKALNTSAVSSTQGELAYNWTTSTVPYPSLPTGDYVSLSANMRDKYGIYFEGCT